MSKILLVEDELELAEKFKKTFEKKGHSVDLAENENEALKYIKENDSYDCIISDYNIAGSNAKQIALNFKEKYNTKICFISGDPSLAQKLKVECPDIECNFLQNLFQEKTF